MTVEVHFAVFLPCTHTKMCMSSEWINTSAHENIFAISSAASPCSSLVPMLICAAACTLCMQHSLSCPQALFMDGGLLHVNAAQDPKAWAKAQTFAQTLVHLTSLMHAVALQHLRSDWVLANLTPYRPESPPPPLVQLSLSSNASRQGSSKLVNFPFGVMIN